jgi:hypothetical protein
MVSKIKQSFGKKDQDKKRELVKIMNNLKLC